MSLLDELRQVAPQPVRLALDTTEGVEGVVTAVYEAGRQRWPTVTLSTAAFAAHVVRNLPSAELERALALLEPDVYLAAAAALGDPAAHEALVREHRAALEAAVQACGGTVAAEIVSQLFERLLYPLDGSPPRIVTYAGRGKLANWLKAAAVHLLVDEQRAGRRELTLLEPTVLDLVEPTGAADAALGASEWRALFTTALRQAYEELPERDQVILRLHGLESASIDDLGRLYGVHRVTAFRWLERARRGLADRTRARLRERLGVSSGHFESLMRSVPSQIDVSLRALFAPPVGDPDP